MSWHLQRLAPFDLETTSPNPEEARIVEAYIGEVGGGLPPVDRDPLLIDPGVEVPAESTKFHGFTTEYLREHGVEAAHGVNVVATAVAGVLTAGLQRWLRSPKAGEKQDPDAVVSGAWPIQAAPALTP